MTREERAINVVITIQGRTIRSFQMPWPQGPLTGEQEEAMRAFRRNPTDDAAYRRFQETMTS